MPAPLIQVPGQTDQIKEFLGDGNVQSIPAITGSDINDGDLLNATRTVDLGSGYKFEITLPSGRVLESAPVGSDYPRRDAILQWLDAVRNSIVEDAADAARASRDAHLAEARTRDLQSPSSDPRQLGELSAIQPASGTGADPVEYAKLQLNLAIRRLAELSSAEADVAKWNRVVLALTGESIASTKKRRKRRKKSKLRATIPSDSTD